MKYFQICSRSDGLGYFAYAPNEMTAIKLVEALMGPQNPSQRIIKELPECPEGYQLAMEDDKDPEPQILAGAE